MKPLGDWLRRGLALHQQGQLAEAEKFYAKVLKADNKQFDALHLLGLLKNQQGDALEALRLISAALRIKPQSAEALLNHANILCVLNRHQEALASFDRALSTDPSSPDAHYNRGNALMALNRSAEALQCYERALALRPANVLAHYNRGHALVALDRPADALAAFDKVLAMAPNHPDAWLNRGNVLKAVERFEEALASYDRALALRPDYALAHFNRGATLAALFRYDEALENYDRALAFDPNDLNTLTNRCSALIRLNRHEDALACSERILAIAPQNADALNNRGIALMGLNRQEEALVCFDRSLSIRPDHSDTFINRADALKNLDRYEEAAACLERACARWPDNAIGHWNLGMLRMAMCDFERGWRDFEWRWKVPALALNPRPHFQPRWNGERLDGTLLVWGEHGLGDEILYSSMVHDLEGRVASVVIETEPRLVKLFTRSFPAVSVVGRGGTIPDTIKAQTPLASVGQYLRANIEAFPRRENGYLVADPDKVRQLRQRLAPGGEVVVGLSWISKNPAVGQFKTALLLDFEPVLRLPGCRFIDLQYGDTLAEREAAKQAMGAQVERLEDIDNTNDIDGLAALIAACDLVVTVSNTTAHLAGALGKHTWVFAPQELARFWYWSKDRGDALWYPHVRIKRQRMGQSWPSSIASSADEIAAFVKAIRGL